MKKLKNKLTYIENPKKSNRLRERNILIEATQVITYSISIEKDDFIRIEMQNTLDNLKDLIEEKEKYI